MPRFPEQRETTVRDGDLLGLAWRKSSACYDTHCVVVAEHAGHILIRDTRDVGSTALTISCEDWAVFVARIRDNVTRQVFPTT
jgi:hypothetical protein